MTRLVTITTEGGFAHGSKRQRGYSLAMILRRLADMDTPEAADVARRLWAVFAEDEARYHLATGDTEEMYGETIRAMAALGIEDDSDEDSEPC